MLTSSTAGKATYSFLVAKWGWDQVLTGLLVVPGLSTGALISKAMDKGFIELLGPHGVSTVLPATASSVAQNDKSALVTTYALYMLVGLLVLVISLWSSMVSTDGVGLVLVYLTGLVAITAKAQS